MTVTYEKTAPAPSAPTPLPNAVMLIGPQADTLRAVFAAQRDLIETAAADHDEVMRQEGYNEQEYHETACTVCRAIAEAIETLATAERTFLFAPQPPGMTEAERHLLCMDIAHRLDFQHADQSAHAVLVETEGHRQLAAIRCRLPGMPKEQAYYWRWDTGSSWGAEIYEQNKFGYQPLDGDLIDIREPLPIESRNADGLAEKMQRIMQSDQDRRNGLAIFDAVAARMNVLMPGLGAEHILLAGQHIIKFDMQNGSRFGDDEVDCSRGFGSWEYTAYVADGSTIEEGISDADDNEADADVIARALLDAVWLKMRHTPAFPESAAG